MNTSSLFPDDGTAVKGARRNIELKAKLSSLDQARKTAEQVATRRLGMQHQVDTYFRCAAGRLKLREIDGQSAQLIWYFRPDHPETRGSQYFLLEVHDPVVLKRMLESGLGIWQVVTKRREIFLYHNVRIHLDDVERRGSFLEFEAVLGPGHGDEEGADRVAFLRAAFGLADQDLLSGSYADLD
jgi:adenylate cyclase class IV